MDDNFSDIGTGTHELTDVDKTKLLALDDEWKKFCLGMNEARDVLRKCHQDFKQNQEEEIEEFKREVVENKENFKGKAPFAISKDFEIDNNKKAFDTIQEF